jgi:signal transduction histidine kinase
VSQRILAAALTGGAAEVQQAIRTVFVDGSATVELPDGRGGWLDIGARPVPPAVAGTRRFEMLTVEDGGPLLRIGFDPSAVQDESLIATAVEAVRVGTHNTRLRAELLAAMSELGSSRERIVEAGLAERRRVERNLHDGAQQQLLAVAATLAETDFVADDELRGVVSRARASLSDALAELRALARGIHPPALSQGGLPVALPALCERAPWPVELHVDPETRDLPDAIEAAAYFVVAEVLTNAARHAGARTATVEVRLDGATVRIDVADDGRGGARLEPGGGLAGLLDRVNALGGTMVVGAAPMTGTAVHVTLPARRTEPAP